MHEKFHDWGRVKQLFDVAVKLGFIILNELWLPHVLWKEADDIENNAVLVHLAVCSLMKDNVPAKHLLYTHVQLFFSSHHFCVQDICCYISAIYIFKHRSKKCQTCPSHRPWWPRMWFLHVFSLTPQCPPELSILAFWWASIFGVLRHSAMIIFMSNLLEVIKQCVNLAVSIWYAPLASWTMLADSVNSIGRRSSFFWVWMRHSSLTSPFLHNKLRYCPHPLTAAPTLQCSPASHRVPGCPHVECLGNTQMWFWHNPHQGCCILWCSIECNQGRPCLCMMQPLSWARYFRCW